MLERLLIEHAAPTLASIKTASLFCCFFSSAEELYCQILKWNFILNRKGVSILILCLRKDSALLYVYRSALLQENLCKSGVKEFLAEYGYCGNDVDKFLLKLQEKLAVAESFPHEIGIFLGYPLRDVVGFIQNGGKNYKSVGLWKVYDNEKEALCFFEKIRKCRDLYMRLWKRGMSITQLTVAV